MTTLFYTYYCLVIVFVSKFNKFLVVDYTIIYIFITFSQKMMKNQRIYLPFIGLLGLCFFVLFSSNFTLLAAPKSKTYFSLSTGAYQQRAKQYYPKIGFNSFGISSGLERHYSINNRIRFSLNYQFTYFYTPRKLNETAELSTNTRPLHVVSVGLSYPAGANTSVYLGAGIGSQLETRIRTNTSSVQAESLFISTQKFNFSPQLSFGIEREFTLFNKNMCYKLQYQFGMLPSRVHRCSSPDNNTVFHGISIGIRYKL